LLKATMIEESIPQVAAGDGRAAGHHAVDRWVRVGWWVMWGSIAARVIVVLVITRGWFFTNDDWDYLSRDGLGQVFEPHGPHITVLNAIAAVAVRQVAGLEYWPGYALVVAVAWPTVAVAAWWVWCRRGVHPLVASGGAVLLTWLGSAAFMQFSHVNPAWAIAATLIALEFDERPVSLRNTGAGLALSLIAAFADTAGAVAVGVRLVLSLIYRRWNGAITAGISLATYVVVRAVVTEPLGLSFGIGDIPTVLRAVVQALGSGLHWIVPFPTGFEGAAGILLIVAAISIIVVSRFSYHATTVIIAGGAWLAAAALAKFMNWWGIGSEKLNTLLTSGFPDNTIIGTRFTNVVVTFMIVAALPILWSRIPFDRIRRPALIAGITAFALITVFSGMQAIRILDRVSDKSVPLAEIAGGFVSVRLADEPRRETANQRQVNYQTGPFTLVRVAGLDTGVSSIDFSPRVALQSGQIDWFIERGWAGDILRSSIYDVRSVTPDTDWSRALARFDFSQGLYKGTWADLGQEDAKGCIPLDDLGPMQVHRTTRFKLTWVNDPTTIWQGIIAPTLHGPVSTHLIVLRLEDDFGRSEIGITLDLLTEEPGGTLSIEVMGPEGGIGHPTLTISGPQTVSICHKKADIGG
jgi:hypothetical protein